MAPTPMNGLVSGSNTSNANDRLSVLGGRLDDTVHAETAYCTLLPQHADNDAVVCEKIRVLAQIVSRGESIATATNYEAAPVQERESTKVAIASMKGSEADYWIAYNEGRYRLPDIDWNINVLQPPIATRPLKTARRRAEALNLLYKSDKAQPGHAVWWTQHLPDHLPIVKAMARVIGAERNFIGGQNALTAIQLADLQTINLVLSISSQVLGHNHVKKSLLSGTGESQRTLGASRERLRSMSGGLGIKRKSYLAQ